MKKSLLFLAFIPFLLTGCEININTDGSKSVDDIIYKREVEDEIERKQVMLSVEDCIENKVTSYKISATMKQENDIEQGKVIANGTYTLYNDEFVESNMEMKTKSLDMGVGIEEKQNINQKMWRMESGTVLSISKYDDAIEFNTSSVSGSFYKYALTSSMGFDLTGSKLFENSKGEYSFVQNNVAELYSAEVYGTETRELYQYTCTRLVLNVDKKGTLKDYNILMLQRTNRDPETGRWYSSPKDTTKIEAKVTYEVGTRKDFKERQLFIDAYSGLVYRSGYLGYYGAYYDGSSFDETASAYNYPTISSKKVRMDDKDPTKVKLQILFTFNMPEDVDGYVNAYRFDFGVDYYKDGLFASTDSMVANLSFESVPGEGISANYDTGINAQWLVFAPGEHIISAEFEIQLTDAGLSIAQIF